MHEQCVSVLLLLRMVKIPTPEERRRVLHCSAYRVWRVMLGMRLPVFARPCFGIASFRGRHHISYHRTKGSPSSVLVDSLISG